MNYLLIIAINLFIGYYVIGELFLGRVVFPLIMFFWGRHRAKRRLASSSDAPLGRCNICGEPYVGLAHDCRCTNYGRTADTLRD